MNALTDVMLLHISKDEGSGITSLLGLYWQIFLTSLELDLE